MCGSIARDSSLSASQAPIPMEPNSDTATGATPAERARALLPTGVPEFAEFMRVVPGAPFIAKGGSVLVTPEDAFALVGALWPDDTHDVFIATRSGFLFLGRLRRDALQRYSAP